MLSFAWKIRERTTIYVTLLTVLLAALMGLFFVVFRITYPSVQTADAVPQRVLVLDPSDPESLALIHRAQDKSFGLVPAEPVDLAAKAHFPSFTPSYDGFELKLRTMVPPPATPRGGPASKRAASERPPHEHGPGQGPTPQQAPAPLD